MYTAKLIGDTKNIELRRRMVNVEFTDGNTTFNREFQFRVDETIETIKRTVKQYLDELNTTPADITGSITDVPVVEEPVKTAKELAKEAWDADWAKLQAIQPYIDAGVFTGTETAIVTLRNKVKTGFKAEDLGL